MSSIIQAIIDLSFITAANAYREKLIELFYRGNKDGAFGLKKVDCGGTIVQDQMNAKSKQ
jgi:hypothetical protein